MDEASSQRLKEACPDQAGVLLARLGGIKVKQLYDDTRFLSVSDFRDALHEAFTRCDLSV